MKFGLSLREIGLILVALAFLVSAAVAHEERWPSVQDPVDVTVEDIANGLTCKWDKVELHGTLSLESEYSPLGQVLTLSAPNAVGFEVGLCSDGIVRWKR